MASFDRLLESLADKATTLRSSVPDDAAVSLGAISGIAEELRIAEAYHASAVADREESTAMLVSLRAQLATTLSDFRATQESLAGLEEETYTLSKQVESISKENKALLREKETLQSALREAAGTHDLLTQAFKEKQESFMETIKQQKREARESRPPEPPKDFLRAMSPPPELTEFDRRQSSHISEDVSMRILKKEVAEKELIIKRLEDQIAHLKETAQEAVLRFNQSQSHISRLTAEVSELEQENANLIEETESYSLLLQNKTKAGEASSFIQKFNRDGENTVLGQEITGRDADDIDNGLETVNEKKLKAEVKALTIYIEKILSKVMTNPDLEDAIVQKSDETEKYSAPKKPRSSFMNVASAAITTTVGMVQSVSRQGNRASIQVLHPNAPVPPVPVIPSQVGVDASAAVNISEGAAV
ncbi:hypothetical protein HDU83_007784 [Entophlyctis luteolus]|nr:hypothetical protein HDU83_007784 [Entophlyctis luteolus]